MKFLLKLIAAWLAIFALATTATAADLKKGSYISVTTPPASAQVVKIGFYPVSVYQLDMASNTYYVDTYIWFRWKGDIDPTASIEFTNMVEEWGKQQENLMEAPKQLADGSKYQIMRIEGRFVQPFPLNNFPLDKQKLSIMVEDTTNGADTVSYVIDKQSSGIGRGLEVPGWQLDGWNAKALVHDYGTQFGEEETPSSYSVAEFQIEISRPMSFFFWALLFPLTVVLVAALAGLVVKPDELDVRSGLPAGALLTAIFLQKSYADGLPPVGYLLLMDKIYLVAYGLLALTLIRAIYTYKKVLTFGEGDTARFNAVHAMDIKIFVAQLIAFAVAVALIISQV